MPPAAPGRTSRGDRRRPAATPRPGRADEAASPPPPRRRLPTHVLRSSGPWRPAGPESAPRPEPAAAAPPADRKSAGEGKRASGSVDHGGRRIIKQKTQMQQTIQEITKRKKR